MNNSMTGGHLNPYNAPHACYPNSNRHVGDLGNLDITQESGWSVFTFERDLMSLGSNSAASIIGRGLLIHADADDCTTPKTGNAGTRVAQGVIGIAGESSTAGTGTAALPGEFIGLSVLHSTKLGQGATGVVAFIGNGSSVRVVATFAGLPANTNHSMHVHIFGDISSDDGTSTGAHYDPAATMHHDLFPVTPRHMGDVLGLITADDKGNAAIDVARDLLSLTANTGNIIGRGVTFHELIDQGATVQPTGGAGGRLMVSVVGIPGPSRAALMLCILCYACA